MGKSLLPLLIIISYCLPAQAQTEPGDSIPRSLPDQGRPEIIFSPSREGGYGDFDVSYPALPREIKRDSVTLHITPPPYTSYPWVTPPPGMTQNPFAWDYSQADRFRLNSVSSIQTYTFHQTYPTMGNHIQAGASYIYSPDGNWAFAGGLYAAKYSMPSAMQRVYNDMGVNASVSYRINERFTIKGFGQYSLNGQSNAQRGLMTPMYPQNYYGGTIEFRINETWGVEAGMQREFDPIKMKWVNTPIINPVYYGKKKRK
ncbi:MAG: hypothetical protein LUF85_05575 [Bacteroides sp.]|nr:hypothetical protein [Bacteroides sp.]